MQLRASPFRATLNKDNMMNEDEWIEVRIWSQHVPNESRLALQRLIKEWRNAISKTSVHGHISPSMVAERTSLTTAMSQLTSWTEADLADLNEAFTMINANSEAKEFGAIDSVNDQVLKAHAKRSAESYQAINTVLKLQTQLLMKILSQQENYELSEKETWKQLKWQKTQIDETWNKAEEGKNGWQHEGNKPWSRDISQHKGIMGMKCFNNDRDGFQNWNDKLINNFSQVHPGMREVMKEVNKKWLDETIGLTDAKVDEMFKHTMWEKKVEGVNGREDLDEK